MCIYIFFGKNRILQLLISAAKIYSNKLITYSQINNFLNKLNFNGDIIHLVFLLITPIPDNRSVFKLNDFMRVIKSLNDYRIMVDGLKENLIATVLTERIYEYIATKVTYNYSICDPSYEVLDDSDNNNRNNGSINTITATSSNFTEGKDEYEDDDIDIYGMENRIVKEKNKEKEKDDKYNNKDNKNDKEKIRLKGRANQYPRESCFSKFTRVVFTDIPAPYTYDYYLVSPDKYSFDNIIYSLKRRNGYGNRNQGDDSARSQSFKHIMSGRHNSSKLSNNISLKHCPSTNIKYTNSHLLVTTSNNYSAYNVDNNTITSSTVSKATTTGTNNNSHINNQQIASHSILMDSISNPSNKNVGGDRISITVNVISKSSKCK